MKQSQRIAKNTAFGIFAAVMGGGLQFVSVLIVARFLGVVDFGIFSYLLAFASVFQFIADFGLSNILIREIARRPDELERLLLGARSLMWIFTGVALLLMLVILFCLPLEIEIQKLSLVMGVGYLLLLQSVSYVAVLRATEHMEYNAIGFVAHKVVLVGLLIAVLWLHGGLWGAVWCHFAANLFQVLYYRWMVGRRFAVRKGTWFLWDLSLWIFLTLETIPLGASLGLRQVSWQLEIFLLEYLTTPFALGLFSGPYRFLMGLTLFSAVLTTPLFPMFVRLADESREQLADAYRRSVKWFYLMALPIVAACIAWPHTIIVLLLGESFLPSVSALRLLGLAVVPLFLSALYPILYSTLHRTGRYLASMAGVLAGRIVLGTWLIMRMNYLGACLSVVVAESVLFFVLVADLKGLDLRLEWIRDMLRPLLPFAVMTSVLYLARHETIPGQLIAGTIAIVAYGGLLWRLKNFSEKEIVLIQETTDFARLYLEGLFSKRKVHSL
jgi:O-antigen/teichoic acid export membrane protein